MSSPTALSAQDRRAFVTAQLDRLLGFFARVEGKASFILALNIAMLGIIAACYPVRDVASPRGGFGIVAALCLALSLVQLYSTFFPHLKSGEKQSLLYFQDIASSDWRAYHSAILAASEEDLLEDLACQVWRNAEILKIKFDHMRAAFLFTLIALPFWVLLLLAATILLGRHERPRQCRKVGRRSLGQQPM